MATLVLFDSFKEAVFEKAHNLGSDTLKVALTNSAPSAANTVLANITQISNGNGYTTGGSTLTISSSSQTSGTYKLVAADLTFTASGGTMGTFRYAVYYNDTATNDELIGYVDYGSAVSLLTGQQFTLDHDPTNGILQASG
jgi:hypothetical protein